MLKETEILKSLGRNNETSGVMRLLLETKKKFADVTSVDSLLEIPQYNLTKHIDILFTLVLVKLRKEGRWVYYSAQTDGSTFGRLVCEGI